MNRFVTLLARVTRAESHAILRGVVGEEQLADVLGAIKDEPTGAAPAPDAAPVELPLAA